MDGMLHNFARRKLQGDAKYCTADTSPCHSGFRHGDSAKAGLTVDELTAPLTPRPPELPLRGILKLRKVRFPGDEDVVEDVVEDVPVWPIGLPPPPPFMETKPHTSYPSIPPRHLPPLPPPPSPPPRPPPQIGPPPDEGPRPPGLFTNQIKADEYLNEVAYKLYTRFMDELAEFVNQQGEVVRKRLHVQEKRADLKRLREAVSRCDIALIDHVRRSVIKECPSDDVTLLGLYKAAETARDDLGPIEAEYEVSEVDLGAVEHKLTEKYGDLEKRFEHFFRLKLTSTRQTMPSEIEFEASTTASAHGEREWTGQDSRLASMLHGNIVGDHIKIGQVPMLVTGEVVEITRTPNLEGHEQERPSHPSDAPDRPNRHRSTVTGEDKAQEDIAADLVGITGAEEIEFLQSQPIEARDRRISQSLRGLASRSLFDVLEISLKFSEDLPTDFELQACDSLLLRDEDNETRSTLSDYLVRFDNTRDRVNRWILHRLRISAREAYALRREVMHCAPEVPSWQVEELVQWAHDSLGRDQPYYQASFEDESDDSANMRFMSLPKPGPKPKSPVRGRHRTRMSAPMSTAVMAPSADDSVNPNLSISET